MGQDDAVKFQNFSEDDIEEMSEESGVEEEIIAESVRHQVADEIYMKQHSRYSKTYKEIVWNRVKKIWRGGKYLLIALPFILILFFRKTDIPKKAKVDSLDIDNSNIILTLKSSLPNGETLEQQVTYDLDSKIEVQSLDYMMKKAGVSKPSQLQNETIPISVTKNDGNLKILKYDVNPQSVLSKVNYYAHRAILYCHLVEYNENSELKLTRNVSLASMAISYLAMYLLGITNLLSPVTMSIFLVIFGLSALHYIFKTLFNILIS